jgi:hypothetical protein
MSELQFFTFLPIALFLLFLIKRAWDSWLTRDEDLEYIEQKNYHQEVQKPILNSLTTPEVKKETKKSETIIENHYHEHHYHVYSDNGEFVKKEKNVTPKTKLIRGN